MPTNYTTNMLYPVLTADELLFNHPQRMAWLKKIQPDTGLADEAFHTLYVGAIRRFVEQVQVFPNQVGGKLGTLLEDGLLRAAWAIKRYCRSAGSFAPEEAYSIFTAALFLDIGKIVSLYAVMLSNGQGEFIAQWLPTDSSLVGQAQFYKLRPLGDRWLLLGQASTSLLARQCMPESGLAWIAADRNRFMRWLQVLSREVEQATHFVDTLKPFYLFPPKQALQDRLPPLAIKTLAPSQTALGEEFADWLGASLRDNALPAMLYAMLPTGALVIKLWDVLQLFCQKRAAALPGSAASQPVHWRTVFKQFSRLGFTRRLAGDVQQLPAAVTQELTLRMRDIQAFFTSEDDAQPPSTHHRQSRLPEAPLWDELSQEDWLLLELFYFYYGVTPTLPIAKSAVINKSVRNVALATKPGKFFTRLPTEFGEGDHGGAQPGALGIVPPVLPDALPPVAEGSPVDSSQAASLVAAEQVEQQPPVFVGMVIPQPELLFWQQPLPVPMQNLRPLSSVLFRLSASLEQQLAEHKSARSESKKIKNRR